MKAKAVYPGKPHSMHLEDMPMPKITDIPEGQGVLVKELRVGVDGTDKEINAAEYGNAPEGEQFLITELGARYVSSQQSMLAQASERYGRFDLIFEASGFSPLVFQAA